MFDFVFVLFFNNFLFVKYGQSALHKAASNGWKQVVKTLVENGANIHLQSKVFIFHSNYVFCYTFLIDDWWFFFLKLSFLFFVRMGKRPLILQKTRPLLN